MAAACDRTTSSNSATTMPGGAARATAGHTPGSVPRRDLGTREHLERRSSFGQLGQLAQLPLIVVLRDHHRIETDAPGAFDQPPRLDLAVG